VATRDNQFAAIITGTTGDGYKVIWKLMNGKEVTGRAAETEMEYKFDVDFEFILTGMAEVAIPPKEEPAIVQESVEPVRGNQVGVWQKIRKRLGF